MGENSALSFSALKQILPAEWTGQDLRKQIKRMNDTQHKKIIVLDDDPTGVQTVHGIDVLTQWDKGLLREAFTNKETVFYILTNTRGLDSAEAERINREIAGNVYQVASETGVDFAFVSRSDSTLRGYYPLEIDVLSEEMKRLTGKGYDGHLIIPAFIEGGRLTYQNTHYVLEGDIMVPAQQSEFAKDKVFGYRNGDLTKWVEEKTEGRFQPEDCAVVGLNDIRSGPDAVEEILLRVQGNSPVIVNALSYADLDVLSFALVQAESKGKKFIFRTAASFVKAYGGFGEQGYLTKEKLIAKGTESNGGLVVVGSYVQKTTRQLEHLLQNTDIQSLKLDVEKILNSERQADELERVIKEMNLRLSQGLNVVVYSSRDLVAAEDKSKNLEIGTIVSNALAQIVRSLKVTPKFIIAKGGITSSDVATKGLNIRKARVLGQVSAGIPVWQTGSEAKFPGMPYIVFPGNVGTERTLLETVQKIEC